MQVTNEQNYMVHSKWTNQADRVEWEKDLLLIYFDNQQLPRIVQGEMLYRTYMRV